jgi:uncharacterized membrane protein YoaK (UPF0700 family)
MLSGRESIAQFNPQNVIIWLSMAFQGGAINAGGYLTCHRFVTHATGFATLFGTEFARGDLKTAFGMLSVPAFFLLGSMVSGFFVDRRLRRKARPRYDWMFGFICLAMIGVAWAGTWGFFGVFGAEETLLSDYLLMSLLCLCSGIQNGTITSASGAVIRTTHLTGITTDLGIGLVRSFSEPGDSALKAHEHRGNWLRIGIIVSFILGSVFSALLYFHLQFLGFLAPAFISGTLTLLLIWKRIQNSRIEDSHARAS